MGRDGEGGLWGVSSVDGSLMTAGAWGGTGAWKEGGDGAPARPRADVRRQRSAAQGEGRPHGQNCRLLIPTSSLRNREKHRPALGATRDGVGHRSQSGRPTVCCRLKSLPRTFRQHVSWARIAVRSPGHRARRGHAPRMEAVPGAAATRAPCARSAGPAPRALREFLTASSPPPTQRALTSSSWRGPLGPEGSVLCRATGLPVSEPEPEASGAPVCPSPPGHAASHRPAERAAS